QAEDGIRDFHVTGVQTCALPICTRRASISCSSSADDTSERQLHPGRQRQAGGGRAYLLLRGRVDLVDRVVEGRGDQVLGHLRVRSEESRVGKSEDIGGRGGVRQR